MTQAGDTKVKAELVLVDPNDKHAVRNVIASSRCTK